MLWAAIDLLVALKTVYGSIKMRPCSLLPGARFSAAGKGQDEGVMINKSPLYAYPQAAPGMRAGIRNGLMQISNKDSA